METYKLLNIFIAAGCLSSIITLLAVGFYYVIFCNFKFCYIDNFE